MNHPVYEAASRKEGLLDIVEQLVGPNIKLHHTKLNMKAPGGGAQVEWHTDWGFYPATNDDILEIGLTFDDMEIENGCLMGIPGSHTWPALDHHQDGYFIGAVSEDDFDMEEAVPIRLKAGGVSILSDLAIQAGYKRLEKPTRLPVPSGVSRNPTTSADIQARAQRALAQEDSTPKRERRGSEALAYSRVGGHSRRTPCHSEENLKMPRAQAALSSTSASPLPPSR